MIKKHFIIILSFAMLISLMMLSFASAAENDTFVYCRKGIIFSDGYYYSAGCGSSADNGIYTIPENSDAVFLSENKDCEINVSGPARLSADENGLFLEEGIFSIRTFENGVSIDTGTEKADISPETKLIVRIDDYGNSFNYCINGSVLLTAKLDSKQYTLSENEYIAVSVKKGIRIPEAADKKGVDKLGGFFPEYFEDSLITNADEKKEITEIESSYEGENVFIKEVPANAVYKIRNTSFKDISSVIYAESSVDNAVIEAYTADQSFIQRSSKANGSLMPNVHITNEPDCFVYILLSSSSSETLKLYSDPYSDIYSRSFETMKKLFPIAGIALVALIVYELIRRKVSKRPHR